jgi:hypothetical protein
MSLTDAELEELHGKAIKNLEFASKKAPVPDIPPLILLSLQTKKGQTEVPVFMMGLPEEKHKALRSAGRELSQKMVEHLGACTLDAVLFQAEAWVRNPHTWGDKYSGRKVSECPDKKEIVLTHALARDGRSFMSTHEITRGPNKVIVLGERKDFGLSQSDSVQPYLVQEFITGWEEGLKGISGPVGKVRYHAMTVGENEKRTGLDRNQWH